MLTRIVRMVFDPVFIPTFLENFHANSAKIRSFDGCEKLELWRDERHSNIYYTHSHWQSKAHLDQYRQSELFKGVWKKTKVGFVDRPQAYSTYTTAIVEPTQQT